MLRQPLHETETYRLPTPTEPAFTPSHFVLCPAACFTPLAWCWQQAIYQAAFEQARAAIRPSIIERDLAGVWN